MSRSNIFENGSWAVICDVCGREYWSHQLTKRWDGLMVCSGDWEPRHPQDFVKGVADKIVPAYTRPESTDTFVFFCTIYTSQGVADYGSADCARADTDNGYRPELPNQRNAIAGLAIAGISRAGYIISSLGV